MKTLTLLLAFVAFNSYALPNHLKCTSNGHSAAVKSFEITNLDGEESDSTIPDSSLLGKTNNNYILDISFSNECDNAYGMIFYVSDLKALESGTVTEVQGLMNYFDVELSEMNLESETTPVTCTLAH